MKQEQRVPYLFLLQRPSVAVRREAAERLRERGLPVVAQYGQFAIEAQATPSEAEAAFNLGIFSLYTSKQVKNEYLEKMSDEQRRIVRIWNTRFADSYRSKDREARAKHEGKSWGGGEGVEPLLPYTPVDPEDFKDLLERHGDDTGGRPGKKPRKPTTKKKGERMSAAEFVKLERELADKYNDINFAHDLARLAYRLEPEYRAHLQALSGDLLKLVLEYSKGTFGEASCWEMTGEMSVGVVFVESSRSGGPKFGNSERDEILQEILDGHGWLTSEHPSNNLSWVYDFQFIGIDVADGDDESDEAYWRNPAMGKVSFDGNTYSQTWGAVAEYREDMRVKNASAHAFVIFVTPYGNSWHAYASGGRVTLAKRHNWGGWGQGTIDRIAAHETSHLFGSADEYTGSGTPCSSCDTTHGCDRIPNGNCGTCASPQQSCVMGANALRICNYTRGQIGWAHIFVELWTADESLAGTDDDVWLDIGDRTFVLDTPNHDDRERGNREGYALWAGGGISNSEIKRILIRKSSDGDFGGWKLKRVRVWHEGTIICDRSPNRWLEDDKLTWVGCINDESLVNSLTIKITTANVSNAGTDDDVTLRMVGRHWNLDNPSHDDFERGNTDTFNLDPTTGLRRSDIHTVTLEKSPDGWFGGWKLKGVEIIVNGTTIYNKQSINRWLEDDSRTFTDGV